MSAPRLVGITGYAGVGKDTAAGAFVKAGFVKIGFADALRRLAYDLNPERWGGELQEIVNERGWDRAKREEPWIREFLKELGNGVRKHVDAYAWLDRALREYEESQFWPTVIPDVRFTNEADALDDYGGVLLRIDRPGFFAESDFEKEIKDIAVDTVISNNGTPADLKRAVAEWYAFHCPNPHKWLTAWHDSVYNPEYSVDLEKVLG